MYMYMYKVTYCSVVSNDKTLQTTSVPTHRQLVAKNKNKNKTKPCYSHTTEDYAGVEKGEEGLYELME